MTYMEIFRNYHTKCMPHSLITRLYSFILTSIFFLGMVQNTTPWLLGHRTFYGTTTVHIISAQIGGEPSSAGFILAVQTFSMIIRGKFARWGWCYLVVLFSLALFLSFSFCFGSLKSFCYFGQRITFQLIVRCINLFLFDHEYLNMILYTSKQWICRYLTAHENEKIFQKFVLSF
jgi:hypothetical protein